MGKRQTRRIVVVVAAKKKRKKISKNTNYKKGRQFEYRVKKYYEMLGWYVRRSYASKGAEDLNAQKKIYATWGEEGKKNESGYLTKVLHIQCKNLKVEKPLNKDEKKRLKELSNITGGKAMHVYNDKNHRLVFEEIK